MAGPQERLQSTVEHMEQPRCTSWMSHHDQDWASQCGWDHSQRQQDPWVAPTLMPLPSLECGFESDRSLVSTSSLGHHGLTDLGAPGIHTMVNATGSLDAM